MAVRSDRIVFQQVTGTGANVTVFTVPADRTLIVKRVAVFHFGPAAGQVFVRGFDGSEQAFLYYDGALAVPGFVDRETWHVLREGDVLSVSVAVGNFALVWISGALLEGDAT